MAGGNFDPFGNDDQKILTDTIDSTKDETCIQDLSKPSFAPGESGIAIAHFSADQFKEAGATDMVAQDVKLTDLVPDNSIVSGTPIVDVTEILAAGAATITVEKTDGTVVATLAADLTAKAATSEAAALPIATKADDDWSVHVILSLDSATGAFILYVPYVVGAE